jgi:predicted nucleic acid-binding protein
VLVDTSVWVDHFRRGNRLLEERLHDGEVWTHLFVIGDLGCGNLRRRSEVLALMAALPSAPLVDHQAAMSFIDSRHLAGQGIGWIDVHLLASATLAHLPLWTLDRRLEAVARRLRLLPEFV